MDAPYEVLTNLLRFALQFLSDKQKKQFKMAACVVRTAAGTKLRTLIRRLLPISSVSSSPSPWAIKSDR